MLCNLLCLILWFRTDSDWPLEGIRWDLSAWDPIPRFNNTDPMIGELEMHLWHVDLGHMACYTSSGCDRARVFGSGDGPNVRSTGDVTCETLRVVESVVVSERIVRIVTGYATHPGVIQIMAFAIENSIGLKPHVDQACLARHLHHLIEASVACSTEFLGQLIRRQDARIEDLWISCLAGSYSG